MASSAYTPADPPSAARARARQAKSDASRDSPARQPPFLSFQYTGSARSRRVPMRPLHESLFSRGSQNRVCPSTPAVLRTAAKQSEARGRAGTPQRAAHWPLTCPRSHPPHRRAGRRRQCRPHQEQPFAVGLDARVAGVDHVSCASSRCRAVREVGVLQFQKMLIDAHQRAHAQYRCACPPRSSGRSSLPARRGPRGKGSWRCLPAL